MRHPQDKSSGVFDFKWPTLFNAVIESLDLKEIVMSSRQYTWAGPGDDPLFEKRDRVLVRTGRINFLCPQLSLEMEIFLTILRSFLIRDLPHIRIAKDLSNLREAG